MSYRPGQPIRLEGDRRALRAAVQLAAMSLAYTSGIFALGALLRYWHDLSWTSLDWLQVGGLTGCLMIALATAMGLARRRPVGGSRLIVVMAFTMVALICCRLLLDALSRSGSLVLHYKLYLFSVGAVCLPIAVYIFFASRRS